MATDLERLTPDPLTRPTALTRAVSVAEAARLLGCSVATIRRRIQRGDLRATTQARPQGSAYRVLVPAAEDASAPLTAPLMRRAVERLTERLTPEDGAEDASAPLTPPLAPATVDLAPLVALVERQQAQLVEQARLITLLAVVLQERAPAEPSEPQALGSKALPWWAWRRWAWWRRGA